MANKPAAKRGGKPGLRSSSRLALPSTVDNSDEEEEELQAPLPKVKRGPPGKRRKSAHQIFADSLGQQTGLGLPKISGTRYGAEVESDNDMDGEGAPGSAENPLQQKHQHSISTTSITSTVSASAIASTAAATAKKNAEAAAKKALEEKHNGKCLL